jgi:hypothetical protein
MNLETFKTFYDGEGVDQQFHFTPFLTRHFVTDYLVQKKKSEPSYRVIDIGSGADFWTKPFADVTVDYYMTPEGSKEHIKVNIERESSWQQLLDYVAKNGKFDFCVCSHTIEDLYYPFVALENFSKIAKRGIIVVPSMHREMGRGDRGQPSKGYDHHRFIYHPSVDNKLVAIPKMGHMEYKKYNIDQSGNQNELQFFWKEDISFVEFGQMFEQWEGSPKIAHLPISKGIGNISSVIFEAYCSIDPNQPLKYGYD